MTVAEIKAKLPEAEVYEFNSDSKYVIVVNKNFFSIDAYNRLSHFLRDENGSQCMIICIAGNVRDSLAILEVEK